MAIPLYHDRENDGGDLIRQYMIYTDPLVTAWQCRRV
jgi:hypothetical protein